MKKRSPGHVPRIPLTLSLPGHLRDQLTATAIQAGGSISEVVTRLLEDYYVSPPPVIPPRPSRPMSMFVCDWNTPTGQQCVYFIRAQGTDFFKIGYCQYELLQKRLNALQTGCMYGLIVQAVLRTTTGRQCEMALHDSLQRYRIHGEWFYFPLAIIQQIEALEKP